MAEEKRKTIEIPQSLYEKISSEIEGTQFKTVSEYVAYAARERLAGNENEAASTYSREDEEKIKNRLRALGYL